MKILALTKYGSLAASTRQRFLQYGPALTRAGMQLECSPLLDNDYLTEILNGRRAARASVARGYWRRLQAIGAARAADVIWLHCEFLPYWPGIAERLAARIAGKPIVFDFDDAIFHMYDADARWLVRLLLEGKLESLLRQVSACTCGNAYLRNYAVRFCPNSIIVPTVVDTEAYRPRSRRGGQLTVGWIGSPATWCGVRPLLGLLEKLLAAHNARFLVIGAGRQAEADAFPGLEFRDWREADEIADIQAMDIGIMPLLDRPFERGKSGYKLIQYMACGLPVVASPIGVNAQIVKDNVNGFLASTERQWLDAVAALLADSGLRGRLGAEGRRLAVEQFSLESQEAGLVALFQSMA